MKIAVVAAGDVHGHIHVGDDSRQPSHRTDVPVSPCNSRRPQHDGGMKRSPRCFDLVMSLLAINAAAQPLSGAFNLNGRVFINGVTTMVSSNSYAAWTGTPSDLVASMVVSTNNPANPASSVLAHSSGTAHWSADGHSGTVQLDLGWTLLGPNPRLAQLDNNSGNMGPDWDYRFGALHDGAFTFNYDAIASGNTFGLCGWVFLWSGPEGNDTSFTDVYDPTRSGVITRQITAGQTYDVGLWSNANLADGTGLDRNALLNGAFSWQITEVPEPSVFSMVALAFGLWLAGGKGGGGAVGAGGWAGGKGQEIKPPF